MQLVPDIFGQEVDLNDVVVCIRNIKGKGDILEPARVTRLMSKTVEVTALNRDVTYKVHKDKIMKVTQILEDNPHFLL